MAPRNPKVAQCIEMAKDMERNKLQQKSKERTVQTVLNKNAPIRKGLKRLTNKISNDYGKLGNNRIDTLMHLYDQFKVEVGQKKVNASVFNTKNDKFNIGDLKIRFQIESVFRVFVPIKDVTDIENQKHLLELIAKIQVVILKVTKENREPLERDTFVLAFPKLPKMKQEQFNRHCDLGQRSKSLVELRKYIQDEIIMYTRLINLGQLFCQEDVQLNIQEGISSLSVVSVSGELSTFPNEQQQESYVCHYCKNVGHSIAHCLERKAVLCLRCFGYGHTKNHCRSAMKHIRLEDIKA